MATDNLAYVRVTRQTRGTVQTLIARKATKHRLALQAHKGADAILTFASAPKKPNGFVDHRNSAYADRDKSLDQIVFSKEKAASYHMWHDKLLIENFFSDALAERLISAELRGLWLKKYEDA